jgi:hypothetical protein
MLPEEVGNAGGEEASRTDPWPYLIRGALAMLAAWGMSFLPGSLALLVRIAFICLGLLSTAIAVSRGPSSARLLLSAAGVLLLAHLSTEPEWDSIRFLFRIVLVVSLAGAGFAALPERHRRVAASVLVVVYFGGLVTAVLATPHSPWIADQLRARVYRPFLEFMHLTETYQWFAPGAGPEPLLWFHLRYADGTGRWVEIRDKKDFRTRLEWTRWGSLTSWAHETLPPLEDVPDELVDRRIEAGKKFRPPIPMPDEDLASQYEEPTYEGRFILSTYARHVARTYPHPTDPSQAVTGIKIYGVLRSCRQPEEVAEGRDPLDPTFLSAYYEGEFDADGRLKPSSFHVVYDADGHVVRQSQDPFLYWLIPIVRRDDGKVLNYVKVHAGDADPEDD